MKITEVRIFPTESRDGKLKAFATMTFDDWFVVRNVKIIQGNNGLFVAMPSRKAMESCSKCRFKNVVGARYCNQCGAQISSVNVSEDVFGDKQGSHMDIAHPITQDCREYIQERILAEYNRGDQEKAAQAKDIPQPEQCTEDTPGAGKIPVVEPEIGSDPIEHSDGEEDVKDIAL